MMNWIKHEIMWEPIGAPREDAPVAAGGRMKQICKNCGGCRPSYKGGICEKTGKKTKLTGTCEDWRPKK